MQCLDHCCVQCPARGCASPLVRSVTRGFDIARCKANSYHEATMSNQKWVEPLQTEDRTSHKGTTVPADDASHAGVELGIDLGSSAGKALGRRILEALTTAYGRMVFSSGFIHGDPHPGNIFVLEGGKVALIDCGQVAQLFREQRLLVAEAVLAAAAYDGSRGMIELLAKCVRKFGVTFFEGQADEDACAVKTIA
eukprot:g839.t5